MKKVTEKELLREKIILKWQKLNKNSKNKFTTISLQKINTCKHFLEAKTIFAYASQSHREVDFIRLLMQKYPEKKYAFPIATEKELEFYFVENYQNLVLGKFTILAPEKNEKQRASHPDFIFVPAVACDLEKNRLGRGRGYYDKFLKKMPNAYKLCILPEFAVFDKIPVENFDEKIDSMIIV